MNQVTNALNNPIAKAVKALVHGIKLTAEISAGISEGTKKGLASLLTKKKTLDLMVVQKITSAHLDLGAKSYADLHKQIKQAIILGFSLDNQALLAKETKTLSVGEKIVKREVQQQIGSEFAYYRRELKKREDRTDAQAEGGIVEKATPYDMYFKGLQDCLERLVKLENVDFDLVAHTKVLNALLADK